MNKISTEKAIEVLYTVRAYYASLTVGYPKGKDCKGIGDVMCSEIANSCLKAIEALEQEPCEDAISRQAVLDIIDSDWKYEGVEQYINALPPVNPQPKTGHWIIIDDCERFIAKCSECGQIEDSRMISKYPYCHCGAKMVELQESER